MINLILNAVDAMPEGGTLILENFLDVRNRLVEIHVEDSGHGISPDDLPHIFEPFFTTKTVEKASDWAFHRLRHSGSASRNHYGEKRTGERERLHDQAAFE